MSNKPNKTTGGVVGRREFIQTTVATAISLSTAYASPLKETGLGIVVHSYASRWNSKVDSNRFPGFATAIELIEHSASIGAKGVQVTVNGWDKDFANRVRERREKLGMYLEGSISLPRKPEEVEAFEQTVVNAREAGASVIRTVCLNGRRYESFQTAEAFEEFKKNSIAALQLAEPVVKKNKVKLAVENHKDWRATELAGIIRNLSSEWVGVTLDFGNSIALLEEPMHVIKTLVPYIMSTHVKDMGFEEYPDGFLMSEVPLGTGALDLPAIFQLCRDYNPTVTFNLEMITRDPLKIPCMTDAYWSTLGDTPGKEVARTLKMVKEKHSKTPLPRVEQLPPEERLAAEEKNITDSIAFAKTKL